MQNNDDTFACDVKSLSFDENTGLWAKILLTLDTYGYAILFNALISDKYPVLRQWSQKNVFFIVHILREAIIQIEMEN